MCHLLSRPCCSGTSRVPNFILALRQFSRRENSAKPSTWKGGNAFGSIEPQLTTTSETSCWEDQRHEQMLWVCAPEDTKAEALDASSAANTLRSSATELRGRSQCTFSLANRRHFAGPVDRLLAQRDPQISHGRNPSAVLDFFVQEKRRTPLKNP